MLLYKAPTIFIGNALSTQTSVLQATRLVLQTKRIVHLEHSALAGGNKSSSMYFLNRKARLTDILMCAPPYTTHNLSLSS